LKAADESANNMKPFLWQPLRDFSPIALKRTASTLIKEVGQTLTASEESSSAQHDEQAGQHFSNSEYEARLMLTNLP
jgi:hypothetical protein